MWCRRRRDTKGEGLPLHRGNAHLFLSPSPWATPPGYREKPGAKTVRDNGRNMGYLPGAATSALHRLGDKLELSDVL